MHGVIEQIPIPGTHVRRAKCKIKLILIPERKFLIPNPRVFTRCNSRLLQLVHREGFYPAINELPITHSLRDFIFCERAVHSLTGGSPKAAKPESLKIRQQSNRIVSWER